MRVASITEAWIETPSRRAVSPRPCVASITEAWIETEHRDRDQPLGASPPSRRRGSKLFRPAALRLGEQSPPSRRRGSKPNHDATLVTVTGGRLHHGGVDRNLWSKTKTLVTLVASITEAWIETFWTHLPHPGYLTGFLSRRDERSAFPAPN